MNECVRVQSRYTRFTLISLFLSRKTSTVTRAFPLLGKLKLTVKDSLLRNLSTEAVFSAKNSLCEITGPLTSDTVFIVWIFELDWLFVLSNWTSYFELFNSFKPLSNRRLCRWPWPSPRVNLILFPKPIRAVAFRAQTPIHPPKARRMRICRRTTEKQQFRWPMTHSIYQNYLELIWFRGSNYFVNRIQQHTPTTLGGQQHFSKI